MIGLSTGFAARAGLAIPLVIAGTAGAMAAQPLDWQLGFQEPATAIKEGIVSLHDFLLIIITGISLFVLALLLWVIFRYNEKANPVPSKTSHNTTVEIVWTVVPVLILVIIAIPSFRLLYAQHEFPKPDLVIKATGHQWYWTYEYPDHGPIAFDSYMIEDADLKEGQPRLLAVDNEVVVPVNKVVHVLVTASNVMHNWTVPAFGSKIDAVPGRVTRTWFKANKTGTFYGQCSELCGTRHAFMPIAVRVVNEQEYQAWLEKAKVEFAVVDPKPLPVAAPATTEPVAKLANAKDTDN